MQDREIQVQDIEIRGGGDLQEFKVGQEILREEYMWGRKIQAK